MFYYSKYLFQVENRTDSFWIQCRCNLIIYSTVAQEPSMSRVIALEEYFNIFNFISDFTISSNTLNFILALSLTSATNAANALHEIILCACTK